MFLPPEHIIEKNVRLALEVDLGTGDITSVLTVPDHLKGTARFITKEAGVICGWPVVKKVFQLLNPEIELTVHYPEGATVKEGDTVAEISGPLQSIFTGERVALNFLQRLSGIATCTRSFREMLADFPHEIGRASCRERVSASGVAVAAEHRSLDRHAWLAAR